MLLSGATQNSKDMFHRSNSNLTPSQQVRLEVSYRLNSLPTTCLYDEDNIRSCSISPKFLKPIYKVVALLEW